MRVFVAVRLDDEIKKGISRVSGDIKKACGSGRYVDPANYHITLEFIGEIDPGRICEIKRVMDDSAAGFGSFDVNIGGVGRFVKGRSSIVWIGAKGSCEGLLALNRMLRRGLGQIGLASDSRKFNPHITIGRKVVCNDDIVGIECGPWIQRVDGIVLMESARINGRLMYTPIYESGFEL